MTECRMYENEYPSADDNVYIQVIKIEELGVQVSLLEYNNIKAMIQLSEVSRRRIRSINKLIRVGRKEVAVVIRVDEAKGYIDLSKRRVSPDDTQQCEAKYNMSKAVHTIMRNLAAASDIPMLELYEKLGWPLYREHGHAYHAFQKSIEDPTILTKFSDVLPMSVIGSLQKDIIRRMKPQPVKIRADLEVTCFAYEGIEAIKAALKEGEKHSTKETPIKIKLVAPPLYVMMTSSLNKTHGISVLNAACESIAAHIKTKGGRVNIKTPARAVTERDDKLLATLMESLEKQNTEVAGDSDVDE